MHYYQTKNSIHLLAIKEIHQYTIERHNLRQLHHLYLRGKICLYKRSQNVYLEYIRCEL
jgi:IS1 family transposase